MKQNQRFGWSLPLPCTVGALLLSLQRGKLNLLSLIINGDSKCLSVVRVEDFGHLDATSSQWQFNSDDFSLRTTANKGVAGGFEIFMKIF